MFMAPQIRNFIVKYFFDNSKSIGNRLFTVKEICDRVNGTLICLVASSIAMALKKVAENYSYSNAKHRG